MDAMKRLLREARVKALTFDKIISHLTKASKDNRGRERRRARIAMRTIHGWMKESEEELKE